MAPLDHELMVRVRQRDAAAFEVLYSRYEQAVHQHLARTVRDPHAAADLVQEVFLRVWTRAEQWEERGSFKAWLFRVATNLALNHLRSVRRRREDPFEVPAEIDEEEENLVPGWLIDVSSLGPETAAERSEHRQLVRQLVAELPDEKQTVLRLAYEDELSLRETAAVLGVPVGTVKSRLHYAMKRLAREWNEIAEEEELP